MGADRFSGQTRCEAQCLRIGRAPQRTRRTDPPHRRPGVFEPWRRCASLPIAPHRHAKRAWPRHKIIPVKWFNLVGKCSSYLENPNSLTADSTRCPSIDSLHGRARSSRHLQNHYPRYWCVDVSLCGSRAKAREILRSQRALVILRGGLIADSTG
jgi:hypothetical protein